MFHPGARHRNFPWHAGIVLALALFGPSCASTSGAPPLSDPPTESYFDGKVVWRDLLTVDVANAKKFYGGVFGWDFAPEAKDTDAYTVIYQGGRAIGGIVRVNPETSTNAGFLSQWIASVSVRDVEAVCKAFEASGGRVLVKPREYGSRGRIAVVQDSRGGCVGLVHGRGGDPADREAPIGEWLWSELWSDDPAASQAQYASALAYTVGTTNVGGGPDYTVFQSGGKPRAGLVKNPVDGMKAVWLQYVRVENPAVTAKQAESMGGRVVLQPKPEVRNGSVAIVVDPTGAAVALQKWPL